MTASRCSTPTSALRALAALAAVLSLLGIVGLAGIIGLLDAAPAHADGEVSWAVRTASNDFGADRQNYSYTVDPGGHVQDALVVSNRGAEPLTLSVYAADGFTTEAGQLDLLTPGEASTGVGVWAHPSASAVTVPAGESVDVPFAVDVPANVTPGDYMGGLVTSLSQTGQGTQFDVDRRLAIRIKLRVGGQLDPSLAIEDLRVEYSGSANPLGEGEATISYTIRNSGNAILTARQTASVSGIFGRFRVQAEAIDDSPALLPGDTWTVSVRVPGVTPALRLAATVTVTPLVTDASGTVAPLPAISGTAHAWTIPWVLLLVVALLIASAAWLVVRRRRGRRAAAAREDARVQERVRDALRERDEAAADAGIDADA